MKPTLMVRFGARLAWACVTAFAGTATDFVLHHHRSRR
jgi:hypothetical protein